jgi:hypothetical protein
METDYSRRSTEDLIRNADSNLKELKNINKSIEQLLEKNEKTHDPRISDQLLVK